MSARSAALRPLLLPAAAGAAAHEAVPDGPCRAVTDEPGAFRIDGLPPGAWRVTMWHERFRPRGRDEDGRPVYEQPRTVTQEITIAPERTAVIAFELT